MSEKLDILVVEDDAALRDAVCLTLELAGHRALGVDGGPAALQTLETHAFNLVLSDLRMQPMDGWSCWARSAIACRNCRCCS